MSIGTRIKEERQRQGITQLDLGLSCNLPGSAISHFERGRRVPTIHNLKRIAKALNVSLDSLCEMEGRENG